VPAPETLLEIARDPKHLGAEIGFFSVTRMGQVCGNVNRNLKWVFVETGWW
jgi:hypothetical protein